MIPSNSLGGIFTKENVEELSGIGKISEMVTYLKSIDLTDASTEESSPAETNAVDEPVAVAPAETASEAAPTVSGGKLNEIILSAIADKTGYPEDMIDADMELEADLGIDSIKRVEIFADILKKLNVTLTPDQTEELSTMSTVEEIASYLSKIV